MSTYRLGKNQIFLLQLMLETEEYMKTEWPGEPHGMPFSITDYGTYVMDEVERPSGEHLPGRVAYVMAERLQDRGLVEIRRPTWDVILTEAGKEALYKLPQRS